MLNFLLNYEFVIAYSGSLNRRDIRVGPVQDSGYSHLLEVFLKIDFRISTCTCVFHLVNNSASVTPRKEDLSFIPHEEN